MALYSNHTDEQLLQLMKENNEVAFTELYNRYWERLYISACKKVRDKEQAKEIVHDVFLDIWKRREKISVNHLPAYLETAVRYRVKAPAFFDLIESLTNDEMTHSPYEADFSLLAKDMEELIEAWIEVLPESRRQIFVRHYFQQLSAQEIAQEMNLSPKTVQNQLSLSLQYLRSRFGHLLSVLLLLLP
jgi:RNA polymerase sigma-70 factor (ECF subfamily)